MNQNPRRELIPSSQPLLPTGAPSPPPGQERQQRLSPSPGRNPLIFGLFYSFWTRSVWRQLLVHVKSARTSPGGSQLALPPLEQEFPGDIPGGFCPSTAESEQAQSRGAAPQDSQTVTALGEGLG